MGCEGSKSTDTQNQNNSGGNKAQNEANKAQNEENKENEAPPQQENKPEDPPQEEPQEKQESGDTGEEEVYVTVEQATTYVSNELGISEEKASKIVQKANKSDDGKIANKELILLWEKIKQKKDEIRPKFEVYDQDNSGTVSCDEAYDILKDIFNGVEEKSVRAMIVRFDENNTGRMNFNEFVFFYAHVCAKKENLLASFKELDKDNTGDLSSDEVCNVLMEECAVEKVQAMSLVEDFDQNNDGKINKAEFETLFMKLF